MIALYKNSFKNRCAIPLILIAGCLTLVNVADASTPTQASNFSVSITGLYLEPNASNLGYAVYTTPLPAPAPNWYQKTVNPDYTGAFDLGLQYDLADKANQIDLDWLHFYSKDAASFAVTQPDTSVGPPYYFGPAEQFLLHTVASSSAAFHVDQINLVIGHPIALSDTLKIKPIFGLETGLLKEGITNNYSGSDPVYGPYTHTVYVNSNFTGVGPRLGFDGAFFVTKHFGLDSTIDGSILLGRLSTSTNFTSWTGYTGGSVAHNNTPANTTLSNQTRTKVVPEVETQLGLFYKIKRHSGSVFSIHTGYMFSDYVNSIYQVMPSSLVSGSWEAGSVAIISQSQNTSDLSLNGPYLRLSWHFA